MSSQGYYTARLTDITTLKQIVCDWSHGRVNSFRRLFIDLTSKYIYNYNFYLIVRRVESSDKFRIEKLLTVDDLFADWRPSFLKVLTLSHDVNSLPGYIDRFCSNVILIDADDLYILDKD